MDRLAAPAGPRCRCGEPVASKTARVYGVEGVVPACTECWVDTNHGRTYETMYLAIQAYHDGRGYRRGASDD